MFCVMVVFGLTVCLAIKLVVLVLLLLLACLRLREPSIASIGGPEVRFSPARTQFRTKLGVNSSNGGTPRIPRLVRV